MAVPSLESFLFYYFMCIVITLSSCIGNTYHHFSIALKYFMLDGADNCTQVQEMSSLFVVQVLSY